MTVTPPCATRLLQPADLDEVLAIAAASPQAPQWPLSAYLPYLAAETGNPDLFRVALAATAQESPASPDSREETILGFACAILLVDGEENLCQLDSMAVRPEARRRGIGLALLRATFAWAAKNGALRLSLEVRASNEAALALYRQFGLSQEGRRTRYYADPEEDALILGTRLPPRPASLDFH
ncbi:MAG TPA: GNAT family N-acetyltransferase [Acidobacteriaceae bacterium]|nr:GNAT family N-acetyltransferase [Acidobacteriaceae bacterium]